MKLLVILSLLKLYARINIFKGNKAKILKSNHFKKELSIKIAHHDYPLSASHVDLRKK